MELGLLIGRSLDGLDPALAAQLPRLAVDRVRVLGARDRDELADAGIDSIGSVVTVVDDAAIRSDPAGVASDGVRAIGGPARSWWLHVDLDVLSTDALAAVDYQQAGGLDWVHLETLADSALAVGGCVGVTVTVYNPDLDPDRGGAARIVAWLAHLVTALDPP
jgi:arginase